MTVNSHAPVLTQEKVGEYIRYEDTERAVDRLADRKFPVEDLTLVAYGLTRGRHDYLSASQTVLSRFELVVSAEHAEAARRALAERFSRDTPDLKGVAHAAR